MMDTELPILKRTSLFAGMSDGEIGSILGCLRARRRKYGRDEMILLPGGDIHAFGVLLSGTAQILREDVTGRQSILSVVEPGDTFAEVFVCAGIAKSPVAVLASADCDVLYLDYERVVHSCTNACSFHSALIQNLLRVLAHKNLLMNGKISYLLLRGIRSKLATYLLERSRDTGRTSFEIPFSRAEMADFLGADRSALSRELGRMRDEGLLQFRKNSFTLLDPDALRALV